MDGSSQESPMASLVSRIPEQRVAEQPDAIDLRILVELERDARIPQRKLADMLGMSSPAIADRISRLKSKGIIKGFSVDIDWNALGNSTVAYLQINAADGYDQNALIDKLLEVRGVEEVTVVTGSANILLRLRAFGFEDLRLILTRDIWAIAGIQKTETLISLVRVEAEDSDEKMLGYLQERESSLP